MCVHTHLGMVMCVIGGMWKLEENPGCQPLFLLLDRFLVVCGYVSQSSWLGNFQGFFI